MNIAPTMNRFSPPNPINYRNVVRFGNTETEAAVPKAEAPKPEAAEAKPSMLKTIWGATKWLFKSIASGIAYALSFELVEGLVHRVLGFGGHGR